MLKFSEWAACISIVRSCLSFSRSCVNMSFLLEKWFVRHWNVMNVHIYLFIPAVFLFLVCEILLENNKPSHINICCCTCYNRSSEYSSVRTFVYIYVLFSFISLFCNDIRLSVQLDMCVWSEFPSSHVSWSLLMKDKTVYSGHSLWCEDLNCIQPHGSWKFFLCPTWMIWNIKTSGIVTHASYLE